MSAQIPTGAERIAIERKRQIKEEGWAPEHDDEHDAAELCIAAACYALVGTDCTVVRSADFSDEESDPPDGWPWEDGWFKPKDDISNLVRAGALIAAEIDRCLRLAGEL